MRSRFSLRASAILLPVSPSSAFAFGSCKQGWYYRCLGVDPWETSPKPNNQTRFCFLLLLFFLRFSFGLLGSFIVWFLRIGDFICWSKRCWWISIRKTRTPMLRGFWSVSMCLEAPDRSDSLWRRRNLLRQLLILLSSPMLAKGDFRFSEEISELSLFIAHWSDLMVISNFHNSFCNFMWILFEINSFWFVYSVWLMFFAALSPWDTIGSVGARNFMLCKKPQATTGDEAANGTGTEVVSRSRGGSWKAWFNKSLNLKISIHWSIKF